jgi:hypothetical protein
MSTRDKHIPFDEFSEHLGRIVDRVIRKGEPVVVEKEAGRLVEVKPVTSAKSGRQQVSPADDKASLAAAFGWAEIDIDTYRQDLAESRRIHTHTPDE